MTNAKGFKSLFFLAVAVVLAFSSLLLLNLNAENADANNGFNADKIVLPVVLEGHLQYAMELRRERPGSISFVVLQKDKLEYTPANQAAVLENGILRVPAIQDGNDFFQLELRISQRDPKRYLLSKATSLNAQGAFSALPNGNGGFNYEAAVLDTPGFDKARSLEAFKETLYPYLRSNSCSGCHNSKGRNGIASQAPMHTDSDPELAHEYALTRVNFADPANSKFVVRMRIDRHNCPQLNCAEAAGRMLDAINDWKSRIADMLPQTPRVVPAGAAISQQEAEQWIADDRDQLAPEDRDYVFYTSLHELHNEGLSADELNTVRVALSKALNSVARWAPRVVNPVDVNGKGLLYKFDIRNYWGWNKGVTRLLFGGSDDDLAFGKNKRDYLGNPVDSSVQRQRYNYSSDVKWDPAFSKVVWERVLHGNVEGASQTGNIAPYIDGFHGPRSRNGAGEYVAPQDLTWVETSQLIYTLTRPDVYNSIMMLPMYSDQLEDELGVDKSRGMDSYDYIATFDAITVDSRLTWRADMKSGGSYWKTWDVFTGQLSSGDRSIFDVYADGGTDIRFPWWANPIPKFVDPNIDRPDTRTWSFVASLAQPFGTVPPGCDPQPNFSNIPGFYNCRHYTGTGGAQQSASEIIWSLPNGLQGYFLGGAFNQRRVDAFVNIVRDPRLIPNAADDIANRTGFAFHKQNGGFGGVNDPRLNTGSSCIGCHIDGLNRVNNDLRDWLDTDRQRLPKGPYGVDKWVNDQSTADRVRDLYPPSSVIRSYVESGRKTFLGSMGTIKQAMVLGPSKNVYVEPVIWTVEYVQRKKYKYQQTTSN